MADQRRYIGVRISEQGHRYIKLVTERDRTDYSKALRYLLSLGVKADMENHSDHQRNRTPNSPHPDHQRETPPATSGERHLPDRDSGEDPRLPDSGSPLGDAIRNVYNAGLNPQRIEESA